MLVPHLEKSASPVQLGYQWKATQEEKKKTSFHETKHAGKDVGARCLQFHDVGLISSYVLLDLDLGI